MRDLSCREPRIPNLGRVFGIVYRANERAIKLHDQVGEDLAAFHAPRECADVAYESCDRIMLEAIAIAETVADMKWSDILAEVKARTGGRWLSLFIYESLLPSEGL